MSSSTSDSSKDNSKVRTDKDSAGLKSQPNNAKNIFNTSYPNLYDDFFETYTQNMQNMQNIMGQVWPSSMLPSMRIMTPFELFDKVTDTRLPLCDVIDRGDKYEINLEVPGINKEQIDVKATKNSIRISGSQTEKTKEKGKKYVYSERSYKAFHRQIPFVDEIIPSQISAKVLDGILEINAPKKNPTKVEGNEEFKVNIN